MKIKLIITLSFALVTSFVIQLRAQEIKTRQEAINNLDQTLRTSYDWSVRVLEVSTESINQEYIADNYSLMNEYLFVNLLVYNYDQNVKSMVKVGKTKQLAINLSGEFTLENTGVKPQKYPSYRMKYKNYVFSNATINVPVPGQTWVKFDYSARINTKKLYESILYLKSTLDPDEREDIKLSKFKEELIRKGGSKDITEEQRKYIVQANAANDARDYTNSLLLYNKALEVNAYSYPDAYFNIALIYAGLERYYQAIFAMKQYLVLSPESGDSRKAQDKIYEWELNIKH